MHPRFVTLVVALLLLVGLSGCASVAKPTFTEEQYTQMSRIGYIIHTCGKHGMMPTDTAVAGQKLVQGILTGYQYDRTRLVNEMDSWSDELTQEDCNVMAMDVKQRAPSNQNTAPVQTQQVPSYKPTQTYCNVIGQQVLCSSF